MRVYSSPAPHGRVPEPWGESWTRPMAPERPAPRGATGNWPGRSYCSARRSGPRTRASTPTGPHGSSPRAGPGSYGWRTTATWPRARPCVPGGAGRPHRARFWRRRRRPWHARSTDEPARTAKGGRNMPSEDERKAPRRRGPAGLWHGEQTDGDGGGDRRPRTAQKEHTGRGEGPGTSPRETASPGHPPPAESGADSEETVPVDRATVPGLSASDPELEGSPAAQDDTHEAPGIPAPDAGSTMPQAPEAPGATVPS